MTDRQKDQSLKILFAVDLAVIYINFLFVYVYYNGWSNIPLNAVLLMLYISILWFFISINTNVLNIDSQKTFVDIFKSQLGGSSVLSAGIIVVVAVFGNFRDNDKLILYPLLFIFFISLIYRSLFLKGIKFVVRSGYKQKKALIIGGGHAAEKVMKQILSVPELGYRLYGIIADNYHESLPVGYYLGDFSRFYDTVRSHLIDEVIIALPLSDEKIIISMVERCESEGVRVRIVPDFFRIIRNRTTLERIGDIPLLSIRTEPLSLLRNRIVKRSFDILFSILALALTSPLLFLVSALIKITSHGPIIFKQRRVGNNNKEFNIYKFRSMVVQERMDTDTRWTTEDDPRVTKIGKFIRKTSIDELPQFWNVLMGNMSVVGPRPERDHFIEEFKKHIKDYKVRHLVQSGITGWAQVNGWRGDTSIKERVEHDIYYLENWSLLFDIQIIFKTIFGTKTQRNAY